MKKILLIGMIKHPLVNEVIKRIYIAEQFQLIGLGDESFCNNSTVIGNYKRYKSLKLLNKIPYFEALHFVGSFLKSAIKLGKVDIIHFFYFNYLYFFIIKLLKAKTTTLIISIVGSDFNSVKGIKKKMLLKSLNNATYITSAKQCVLKELANNGINVNKLIYCRFPLPQLEALCKISTTKSSSKEIMGINPSVITITCGYNNSKIQQHLSIIESLNKVQHLLKQPFLLIFPLTYGNSDSCYVSEIRDLLDKYKLPYKLIQDYLSENDLILLRQVSDIYLNLQTMDAYNSCLIESLYTKTITVVGKWLNYTEIRENNIFCFEIEHISELSEKVVDIIQNIDEYKLLSERNSSIIKEIFDWKKSEDSWNKIAN